MLNTGVATVKEKIVNANILGGYEIGSDQSVDERVRVRKLFETPVVEKRKRDPVRPAIFESLWTNGGSAHAMHMLTPLLLLSVAAVAFAERPLEGCLLPNFGFEVDADGNRLPDDWGAKPDAAEPDAVRLVDAEKHGGRWSVRIRHAEASSYTKFRTRVATGDDKHAKALRIWGRLSDHPSPMGSGQFLAPPPPCW